MKSFYDVKTPPAPRPLPPCPPVLEPEASLGKRLEGKKVVITGTTKGVGAAAQELFCVHGATVVGCGTTPGKAAANAKALTDRGFKAYGLDADLKSYESARNFIDKAAELMGGIDVLINNADLPTFATVDDCTPELWKKGFAGEVDVKYNCAQAAWKYLKEAKGASIVNTSSLSGVVANMGSAGSIHNMCEGAIMSWTRGLAADGAPYGIRANTVCPGIIWTEAMGNISEEQQLILIKGACMSRPSSALDIAYMYLFLASDESRMCTGATFTMDGGQCNVLVGDY